MMIHRLFTALVRTRALRGFAAAAVFLAALTPSLPAHAAPAPALDAPCHQEMGDMAAAPVADHDLCRDLCSTAPPAHPAAVAVVNSEASAPKMALLTVVQTDGDSRRAVPTAHHVPVPVLTPSPPLYLLHGRFLI